MIVFKVSSTQFESPLFEELRVLGPATEVVLEAFLHLLISKYTDLEALTSEEQVKRLLDILYGKAEAGEAIGKPKERLCK